MRHVAAYLLLVLGGKAAPTAEDVKGVLDAAGVAADDNQLSTLISALEGKVGLEFQSIIQMFGDFHVRFGGTGPVSVIRG
jgi:ribosomal protein L12E/L44/L45/RPP1/RPP2